ncbi:MAG TPA: hypothetical protein VH583_04560 [Vicinamibacterales bacterium]|jgi:hypothetical protein
MASEKYARLAARRLAPTLKKHRAFAVDVRKLPRSSGHAVFAYFEKKPEPSLPSSTTVTIGRKSVRVPVRVIIADVFKPD